MEIIQVCRDIQHTWSANEELRRRGADSQVCYPPRAKPAVPLLDEVPAESDRQMTADQWQLESDGELADLRQGRVVPGNPVAREAELLAEQSPSK